MLRRLTRLFLALGAMAFVVATPAERPNILFAVADDASYPHMSAYGCDWIETPAFDRVAEEGVLFNRAYTPNAKCAPSRSCVITGRNPWQLGTAVNHVAKFPARFTSYVEVLEAAGYAVGMTGKGWAPGDAGMRDGKKRQLVGTPFQKHKLDRPTTGISPIDYARNFEAFMDTKEDGAPWCFWYGGYEPHRAYEYGSGVAKGGKDVNQIKDVPAFWPDNAVTRNDLLDYAFEIEHFDTHLARMLALLAARGELDNTIVVVTADNGMPFPRVKGQEYEWSNHLPLAIMWKGGINAPGRVVDDFVNFIDFAPTFLEAAGVDVAESAMAPMTGQSLLPIFRADKGGIVEPERDHVLIGKERHDIGRPNDWGYPIRGIIKGDMLYLHNFEPDRWPAGNPETGYLNCDGGATKTNILNLRRAGKKETFWQLSFGKRPAEELYNIKKDPECMENLAADAAWEDKKAALKAQLFEALRAEGDPRLNGNAAFFDTIEYVDERRQNFYERFMAGEDIKTPWVNESDYEDKEVGLPG